MAADSEFVRLTNQHRYARNLKFAQLMSALRLDARSMRGNWGAPTSPSGSIAYFNNTNVSSYNDNDAASECPSETPSHAAGRPSARASLGLLGCAQPGKGRKHYTPSDSGIGDGDDDMMSSRGSSAGGYPTGMRIAPKPRTPAPFADLSDLPSKQQNFERVRALPKRSPGPITYDVERPVSNSGGYARSPPPFANGGNYGAQPQTAARQAPVVDRDFWNRREQANSDVMSQCGQSDAPSIADSQREVFTARDRVGHGNILTWGNDSRAITPERPRTGRQLAMETDGRPTGHKTAGVFPASS